MEPMIERPKFAWKENPAGVYKISFGPDWYYIGGSGRIKHRIAIWISKLKSGTCKNKKIKTIFPTAPYVKFEILEITLAGEHKKKEQEYILKHWDDPFLLNYSPDAESNFGVKHNKHGYFNQNRPRNKGKKTAVFDMEGKHIGNFNRMVDAATSVGCSPKRVRAFLSGQHSHVKGMKFKLIANDGTFIDPTPFVSKKPPLKPKKELGPITASKPVVKKDAFGNRVFTYSSVGEAARVEKVNISNMRKLIKGIKRKSHKGFVFKFE